MSSPWSFLSLRSYELTRRIGSSAHAAHNAERDAAATRAELTAVHADLLAAHAELVAARAELAAAQMEIRILVQERRTAGRRHKLSKLCSYVQL